MSFLNRIFGRSETRAATAHPRDPVLADWFGPSSNTAVGIAVTPDTAMSCPAVSSCIGLLADTVATVPLDLFERTNDDSRARATAHPLFALLHDRPNGWQTSADFRREMHVHLMARGNAYARIRWRGDGGIDALEPMHPDTVMPFRRQTGGHAYRHYPANGPAETLLPGEVLHLRDTFPEKDSIKAKSRIRMHQETIGLAMAHIDYLARFFGNSATPKGALKLPATLSDRAAQLLRETWERRHQGLENAHRMAILDGGLDFVELGANNRDAQTVEAYRAVVTAIAGIWRIPPHLISETNQSTSWGTGIEQQSIGFVTYVFRPMVTVWEQGLNMALLSAEGRSRYFFEFNIDGLLRGDFKSRMEGYGLMIQWGLATPNEIRRLMNLAPLAGGDERMHPLNMAPATKIMDVLLRDPQRAARALAELQETNP